MQEKIYEIARANIGKHLTLDPRISNEEGCAEAVSKILSLAGYDMPEKGIPGVLALREWLGDNGFKETPLAEPGAIISSRNRDGSVAHIGVCLKNGIASNNSFNSDFGRRGLFTQNYSLSGWERYFVDIHGCDLRYNVPI